MSYVFLITYAKDPKSSLNVRIKDSLIPCFTVEPFSFVYI